MLGVSFAHLWPRAFLSLLVALVVGINLPAEHAAWLGGGAGLAAVACLAVGHGISAAIRFPLPVELQFLVGLIIFAYALALPAVVAGVPIVLSAIGFLAAAFLSAVTVRVARIAPAAQPEHGLALALAFAAAAGFAALWSLETSSRFRSLQETGVYRLWTDTFIHAGVIAQFGDARAIGRGNAGMADIPSDLYHFVSYALPGLAVRLSGISPLTAIPGVWIPAGIFATALGLFALGRAVAGLAGGALALFLLASLPDTAAYGLRQGFLSFHWMLETHPTSLYALPCACASLAVLCYWVREQDSRMLALSSLLMSAVFLLRAHIFVWFAVPWAATTLASAARPSLRIKVWLLASGAVLAPVALLWLSRKDIGEVGLLHFCARYLEFLHTENGPTAYDGLQTRLESFGRAGAVAPDLLLAYAGMGGVPLLAFLLGAMLAWRRKVLSALDVFPFALLGWAGLLMVLSPIPFHRDIGDLRHRAFVMLVVTLLCWCARWLLLFVPALGRPRVWALAACAALPVTAICVAGWKAPRMAWATDFIDVRPTEGLVDAANWLRAHSGAGDMFTVASLHPDEIWLDDATVVMGLSGLPAYISRPGIQRLAGGVRAAAARERLELLARVAAAPQPTGADALLRSAGVTFYVTASTEGPRWDVSREAASFRAGTVAVWRIRPDAARGTP